MKYDIFVIETVSPYVGRKTLVETIEASEIRYETGVVCFFNEDGTVHRVIPVPPFYIAEHKEI
jgi:hypothetical protein